ncbi:MAG TPA: MFS transporter [Vicinamibacterales bacterium]
MLAALLSRAGLKTREQRAWAWYDWANSVYFTTVITAVFPTFYATYAASGLGLAPAEITARFSLITTISVAAIAIAAPILGAVADYSGIKKKLLATFMVVGVGSCAAMSMIGQGDIGLASVLFFAGNIGVSGSLVFYDSLLPHVAPAGDTDRVSSAGYAMGYFSGGVMLLINLAWILQPATFGFADSAAATKASFVAVAIWWAAFSIPLFRTVREPATMPGRREGSAIGAAFGRLGQTFREIRKYRHAFLLFIAMLLYQDGIQTVIRMSSVYGAEVGIDTNLQIAAFVMVQFVGIPFAFLFGALGQRIGTKKCIFIAIGVYIVAAGLAYFMTTVAHFFVLAFLVATVLGGSQALSRALFARLIPQDRTSEFFGFFAVSERFATIMGPVLFFISATITGSSRAAILGILGLFVAGGFVLSLVDEEEGARAALQ